MKAWKLAQPKTRPPMARPRTTLYQAMRQCYRKAGFTNSDKAHNRAEEIVAEGGPQMFVYNCTECGKYHLTKNPAAEGRVF